jgi:hypothetical protein
VPATDRYLHVLHSIDQCSGSAGSVPVGFWAPESISINILHGSGSGYWLYLLKKVPVPVAKKII